MVPRGEFAEIRERLGIKIEPNGVFHATMRGTKVVAEGENPEPEPIVIETPSDENWPDDYREKAG